MPLSPPPGDDDGREPRNADEWLREFLSNSALVPVALVAVGSFTALGAGVWIAALRGRNLAALAALLVLAAMSADFVLRNRRRSGRFGVTSRLVLTLWALSACAAAAAVALGLA
jgi:hypothetical protein